MAATAMIRSSSPFWPGDHRSKKVSAKKNTQARGMQAIMPSSFTENTSFSRMSSMSPLA